MVSGVFCLEVRVETVTTCKPIKTPAMAFRLLDYPPIVVSPDARTGAVMIGNDGSEVTWAFNGGKSCMFEMDQSELIAGLCNVPFYAMLVDLAGHPTRPADARLVGTSALDLSCVEPDVEQRPPLSLVEDCGEFDLLDLMGNRIGECILSVRLLSYGADILPHVHAQQRAQQQAQQVLEQIGSDVPVPRAAPPAPQPHPAAVQQQQQQQQQPTVIRAQTSATSTSAAADGGPLRATTPHRYANNNDTSVDANTNNNNNNDDDDEIDEEVYAEDFEDDSGTGRSNASLGSAAERGSNNSAGGGGGGGGGGGDAGRPAMMPSPALSPVGGRSSSPIRPDIKRTKSPYQTNQPSSPIPLNAPTRTAGVSTIAGVAGVAIPDAPADVRPGAVPHALLEAESGGGWLGVVGIEAPRPPPAMFFQSGSTNKDGTSDAVRGDVSGLSLTNDKSIHIAAPRDAQHTPVTPGVLDGHVQKSPSRLGGHGTSPLAPHRAMLDDTISPTLRTLAESAARVRQRATAKVNVDHRDTAMVLLREHARLLAAAGDTLAAVERLLVPSSQ